jgi:hypothetical protein
MNLSLRKQKVPWLETLMVLRQSDVDAVGQYQVDGPLRTFPYGIADEG